MNTAASRAIHQSVLITANIAWISLALPHAGSKDFGVASSLQRFELDGLQDHYLVDSSRFESRDGGRPSGLMRKSSALHQESTTQSQAEDTMLRTDVQGAAHMEEETNDDGWSGDEDDSSEWRILPQHGSKIQIVTDAQGRSYPCNDTNKNEESFAEESNNKTLDDAWDDDVVTMTDAAKEVQAIHSEPPRDLQCKRFYIKICGFTQQETEGMTTWQKMQSGFRICCMAGEHPETLCDGLSQEVFGHHIQRRTSAAPDATLCSELVLLAFSHVLWKKDAASVAMLLVEAASNQTSLVDGEKEADALTISAGDEVHYSRNWAEALLGRRAGRAASVAKIASQTLDDALPKKNSGKKQGHEVPQTPQTRSEPAEPRPCPSGPPAPRPPPTPTCFCLHGIATAGQACIGGHACEHCLPGYHLSDNMCKANRCFCEYGVPAAGPACYENGRHLCASCNHGYTSDFQDGICWRIDRCRIGTKCYVPLRGNSKCGQSSMLQGNSTMCSSGCPPNYASRHDFHASCQLDLGGIPLGNLCVPTRHDKSLACRMRQDDSIAPPNIAGAQFCNSCFNANTLGDDVGGKCKNCAAGKCKSEFVFKVVECPSSDRPHMDEYHPSEAHRTAPAHESHGVTWVSAKPKLAELQPAWQGRGGIDEAATRHAQIQTTTAIPLTDSELDGLLDQIHNEEGFDGIETIPSGYHSWRSAPVSQNGRTMVRSVREKSEADSKSFDVGSDPALQRLGDDHEHESAEKDNGLDYRYSKPDALAPAYQKGSGMVRSARENAVPQSENAVGVLDSSASVSRQPNSLSAAEQRYSAHTLDPIIAQVASVHKGSAMVRSARESPVSTLDSEQHTAWISDFPFRDVHDINKDAQHTRQRQ